VSYIEQLGKEKRFEKVASLPKKVLLAELFVSFVKE
jgi:hypothetical protein